MCGHPDTIRLGTGTDGQPRPTWMAGSDMSGKYVGPSELVERTTARMIVRRVQRLNPKNRPAGSGRGVQ